MPLKYKLQTLDGLDDTLKQLYKEVDGEFVLALEGMPENKDKDKDKDKSTDDQLKSVLAKNQELLDELKKNKKDKQTLEEEKKRKEEEKNKKDGNYEALLKSAQEKIAEKDDHIKKMIDKNNDQMIKTTVKTMASKLCDGSNVSLIEPHIRSRLGVNEKGEIQILSKSGEPSVSTQDELVNEFQSNKDFAPLLRGTSSSGGGATGGSPGGATIPNTDKMTPMEKLTSYHEKEAVTK